MDIYCLSEVCLCVRVVLWVVLSVCVCPCPFFGVLCKVFLFFILTIFTAQKVYMKMKWTYYFSERGEKNRHFWWKRILDPRGAQVTSLMLCISDIIDHSWWNMMRLKHHCGILCRGRVWSWFHRSFFCVSFVLEGAETLQHGPDSPAFAQSWSVTKSKVLLGGCNCCPVLDRKRHISTRKKTVLP